MNAQTVLNTFKTRLTGWSYKYSPKNCPWIYLEKLAARHGPDEVDVSALLQVVELVYQQSLVPSWRNRHFDEIEVRRSHVRGALEWHRRWKPKSPQIALLRKELAELTSRQVPLAAQSH